MLKLFVSLVFALIVAAFVAVGVLAFVIYHKVKGFTSSLKSGAEKNGNAGWQDTKGHGYGNATPDGTVIDTRDPARSRRKIIPADEGEYVDFTE